MNYKLAKQLCDAGFPQVVRRSLPWATADGHSNATKLEGDVLLPSLEELIEACVPLAEYGGDFHLEHLEGEEWGANVDCHRGGDWLRGTTPTEAVARLWLALNSDTSKR